MIEANGYSIVRNAIVKETIAELRLEAERLAGVVPDRAYGIRDLVTHSPRIAELGRSQALCQHLPDPNSSRFGRSYSIKFRAVTGRCQPIRI